MKNENFISIQGWMINVLKLQGNELVLFALIYGFSQDGKSQFKGSLSYIGGALKISKPTTTSLINKLEQKDFIIKFQDSTGNRFMQNSEYLDVVLGSKETLPLASKETLPLTSKETLHNNYIYNNNINSSKGKFENISNNQELLEILAMQKKVKIETIKSKIEVFIKHSISIASKYLNHQELYQHFGNWIRKQNLKENDRNTEFAWFIDKFNAISKKEYVATESVQRLFDAVLDNGFTGPQTVKAICNLYSSSDKNKWHKGNNYQFATPEYLLKGENLNKYLNANY